MQDSLQRSPAAALQATDLELARRSAEGEAEAFEAIMRRHNRLLFRTARSILKSDAEAEDALQDAYLKAWGAISGFRADARLSTWLVRIVVNESLGRLRRQPSNVIALDVALGSPEAGAQAEMQAQWQDEPDLQPDRMAMRAQLRRLLEAHIDILPDAFRSVFVLRAVEEMSVEEVALALDIPEATVRTRFFRARSLLREGMSRDMDMATSDAFSFDGERCDRIVAAVLARIAP